ncbi:AAA family ATPase [Alsobacter sp. SYSU BS001988]
MGILANRTARSPSLEFRRYNLIYGFNGSGKSTLSRLFASLEAGNMDPKLPRGSSFSFIMDNGTVYASDENLTGLEKSVLVFNGDFIEKNLQWTVGKAKPIFFIGVDQAQAAAALAKLETNIFGLQTRYTAAQKQESAAEKAFSGYKRDTAKLTAERLHLGNRRYEANHLQADYDRWPEAETPLLDVAALTAAGDGLRVDKAADPLADVAYDVAVLPKAIRFVRDICGQTLSGVSMAEVQKHPDMLLWIKAGHEYHEGHALQDCLYCGSKISAERRAALARTLDNQIDEFVEKLDKTVERLQANVNQLEILERTLPTSDALQPDLAAGFKIVRASLVSAIQISKDQLTRLGRTLAEKRAKPASVADVSSLPTDDEVDTAAEALSAALQAVNSLIKQHNAIAANFKSYRIAAEESIRKHYIAVCRMRFGEHVSTLEEASALVEVLRIEIEQATKAADGLRQSIRVHKPAADAINRLLASYLGHEELTVHPVDEGYEFRRHGKILDGLPSEGEKTAIALAYFLSTLKSDGRKLKNLIIVIDDPISSLDSKALNFACALVLSSLSDAKQLFVLTHNQQCMNEFRKGWKDQIKGNKCKDPTAAFLFLDVSMPQDVKKRVSHIVPLSKLLRDYDSEYHFLFHHLLKFHESGDEYYDYSYMIPHVLRRVLDVFLAFKCPGPDGLKGKVQKLCNEFEELDRIKMSALERLSQVESHSDNLDDLISFSTMTLEETRDAAQSLLRMMSVVDEQHFTGLKNICTQ